jgi:ornithine--oxo-acid transaminase
MRYLSWYSSTQYFIDLENEFAANNYKLLDVVFAQGQGVWVWDLKAHKYLDMLASYSALNQGHCHSRILNALIEQAKKLTLVSQAFPTDHGNTGLKKTLTT